MSSARKILLAVDVNGGLGSALEWAEALAAGRGASLVIAAVEPGQPTSEFGSVYAGIPDPGIGELARKLAGIVPGNSKIAYEHRVLRGEPVAEIVRAVAGESIEAVVLGPSHTSGLRHALFGGTAEGVLKGVHCPVLVCRS